MDLVHLNLKSGEFFLKRIQSDVDLRQTLVELRGRLEGVKNCLLLRALQSVDDFLGNRPLLVFQRFRFVNFEPFDALTVCPETKLRNRLGFAVSRLHGTLQFRQAVLFAVSPISFVDPAVGPLVDAVAVFLVVYVLAFIRLCVGPHILSEAVHVSVPPLPGVVTTVTPVNRAAP